MFQIYQPLILAENFSVWNLDTYTDQNVNTSALPGTSVASINSQEWKSTSEGNLNLSIAEICDLAYVDSE